MYVTFRNGFPIVHPLLLLWKMAEDRAVTLHLTEAVVFLVLLHGLKVHRIEFVCHILLYISKVNKQSYSLYIWRYIGQLINHYNTVNLVLPREAYKSLIYRELSSTITLGDYYSLPSVSYFLLMYIL